MEGKEMTGKIIGYFCHLIGLRCVECPWFDECERWHAKKKKRKFEDEWDDDWDELDDEEEEMEEDLGLLGEPDEEW